MPVAPVFLSDPSAAVDAVCAPLNQAVTDMSAGCEPAVLASAASSIGRSFEAVESVNQWVERNEHWVPWLLTLFAGLTRFYRLDQPPGVAFDESHFGKFTGWYTKREYYFDIHPPMARVVLWFVGRLVGYDPTKCSYENINEQYGPECKYIFLRTVAATHSTATCVLMYLIARRWGASVWGGILASFLVIFDMLNCIEGRLILLDAQLEFWLLASLFIATCWWQRFNEHYEARGEVSGPAGAVRNTQAAAVTDRAVDWFDFSHVTRWFLAPAASLYDRVSKPFMVDSGFAAIPAGGVSSHAAASSSMTSSPHVSGGHPRTLSPAQRFVWAAIVGIICGNAFSVKMTGLVTPFMVAVESCFAIWMLKRSIPFPDMLVVLFSGLLTYAFWFWCHFALMINWTVQTEEFMTENYQATMLGGPKYNPNARWEGFWWTFVTLNIRMVVHNANILAPHHWQSRWYEWILNQRGVAYYGTGREHGYSDNVYLIGNHALHWLVIVCMGLFLVIGGLYLRYRHEPDHRMSLNRYKGVLAQCAFCLVAFFVNLGPYLSAVERSTFIYHYLPSLMYGQLLSARLIETIVGPKHVATAAKVVFIVVGGTWLFFSPWFYTFALTGEGHARRRWLPRWD